MDAEKNISEEEEEFKMEIKLLNKNKDKISFVIKDTDPYFINTIRRMILTETPTMAIDEVEFAKNSSALYDEVIAHRLGLTPIKTDLKSYVLPEKCKCKGKGCSICQLVFSLKVKGPGNVYAEDIKFKDTKIKAVYQNMLIAKLDKDQELEFKGIATLGLGKQHTKYSPGLLYYRAYPIINLKKPNEATEAIKVCPKHVFKMANKKVNVDNLIACDLCMACVESLSPNIVEVKGSKKDFIITLESWGQLKPIEIFENSSLLFDDKLDEFSKNLKSLK